MGWSNLVAKFYTVADPPVLRGSINAVFAAEGTEERNRTGQASVLLPNNLSSTQKGYIVGNSWGFVSVDDPDGRELPVCCFLVQNDERHTRSGKDYRKLSGPGVIGELTIRPINDHISLRVSETITAVTDTTITFSASASATDDYYNGWIVLDDNGVQGRYIEDYNGTTKQAVLVGTEWFKGTPTVSDPCTIYGGIPTDDEFDYLDTTYMSPGNWEIEAEGSASGTTEGSYHNLHNIGLVEGIKRVVEQSEEHWWFRNKSLDPTSSDFRKLEIRKTGDASGITLVDGSNSSHHHNTSYGIITKLTRKTDAKYVSMVIPTAADNIDLRNAGDYYTLPSGFSYSSDPPAVINDTLETTNAARGSIVRPVKWPDVTDMAPIVVSANGVIQVKKQLAKWAVNFLRRNDDVRKFYTVECILHADIKPGQTVAISNYTSPGENGETINEATLYVQSVKHRISGNKATRYTTLTLSETQWPYDGDREYRERQNRTVKGLHRQSANSGAVVDGDVTIINPPVDEDQFLNKYGDTIKGNVAVDDGITIDGVDISARDHDAVTITSSTPLGVLSITDQALTFNLTGSTIPQHDIVGNRHTVTGSALDIVGLDATNTLAILTPSSDTSAGTAAILRSDSAGDLKLRRVDVSSQYELGGNHILSTRGNGVLYVGSSTGIDTVTTGYAITAVGDQAAGSVTTGNNWLAFGPYALHGATTQSYLVGIGAGAGQHTTGNQGVFIGQNAADYQGGDGVIAIGKDVLKGSSGTPITSSNSVGIGQQAAPKWGGTENFAGGYLAATSAVDGNGSVVVGAQGGYSATTISNSVILGSGGGRGASSISDSVIIGGTARYLSGNAISNSIFIGPYAGYHETNSNRFHISTGATTNPFMYGELPNGLIRFAVQNIEIGDNTNATTLTARTADLTINIEGGDLIFTTNTDLSGENWTSGFLGEEWGLNTGTGHLDVRSLYTENMIATTFTVENSLVKNGSWWLTPGAAEVTRDFTVPASGSTATLYVLDDPAAANTAVFTDDDYVLLRVISGSGASKTTASVWGQVSSYTDLSDGEQSWTFTNRSGTTGLVIDSGSAALGFGQHGDGFINMTTIDAAGSPYARVSTWRGNPYTASNRTVHTQWGNLDGIAGIDREFGLYAGLSPTSARLIATDTRVGLHGMPLSLYNGGDNALILLSSVKLISDLQTSVRPDGDISDSNTGTTGSPRYSQIDNDSTSSYILNNGNSTNAEAWVDLESVTTGMAGLSIRSQAYCLQATTTEDGVVLTAQIFKADGTTALTDEIMLANQDYDGSTTTLVTKPFGYVDSGATQIEWDAARLKLTWYYYPASTTTEVIRLDPFGPYIGVGATLPTGMTTGGDGVWFGIESSVAQMRVGKASGGVSLRWDNTALRITNSAGSNAIVFRSTGESEFSGAMTIGTGGGIWQGTGTFASPTTGLKMSNSSGIGVLQGYNSGTLQAEFASDGKLKAGAGNVVLDEDGITIDAVVGKFTTGSVEWKDGSTNVMSIGTTVDLGAVTGTYIESVNQDLTISTSTSGNILLSADDGDGNVRIDGIFTIDPLSSTPSDPISGYTNIYPKGTKLVVQYNDGGTVRYKYLELSGTGATWTHTTTAP